MSKLTVLPKKYEILDANSDCNFRINIDVLNEAFGVGRAMYAKACYPDKKGVFFSGEKSDDKFFIWMPKLYGNSSEWMNIISSDGSKIFEIAEPTRHHDWIDDDKHDLNGLRLVFIKASHKEPYKFVGVFKSGNMEFCKHTYERIATKIRLIGNPVTKIELLDDVRKE